MQTYQFFSSENAPPVGQLTTTGTNWEFLGEVRMTLCDAKRMASKLIERYRRVRVFRVFRGSDSSLQLQTSSPAFAGTGWRWVSA